MSVRPHPSPARTVFLGCLVLFAIALVGRPALDFGLSLAAPPRSAPAYRFEIGSNSLVRWSCPEGESGLEVAPGPSLRTEDGVFRLLRIQAALCTEFGYRRRETALYLPAELLSPDSEVLQGLWETRTYVGVPSVRDPERRLTLEVSRLPDSQLQVSWVSDGFSEPEYPPVLVTLAQPEEMGVVDGWSAGLLPWKTLHFEVPFPALGQPIVIDARLSAIE